MACGTNSKISTMQQNADQTFANGNYETSLRLYEQIISVYEQEGKTNECPVYCKAALAALNSGNIPKSIEYFEMDTYTPFVTAQTYAGQAEAYRNVDNLSKEMIALKNYLELYPDGEQVEEIKLQLFQIYVKSENWDFAIELWPLLNDQFKTSSEIISQWFVVNQKTKNNDECDALAEKLLNLDPNNVQALEWKAIKAFNFAEDHYQTEMNAYENNKTNKQYKRLLKELDKITSEFQVALDIFDKLYKLDAKPKYARYMSNIYIRFDDKEKADYFLKKAGK